MKEESGNKKKEESEVEGSLLPQEAVKEFKKLKENNWEGLGALDYWARKINPKVFEMEREKKIALLTIASDIDVAGDRGRIHTIYYGAPGRARSDIFLWLHSKLEAGFISQSTSKVGLMGSAKGKEITPGALPANDGGVLTIDELDKFSPRDRKGLLEAMSEGRITIKKGGMEATFDARVRILAGANSIDSFSREILDRFDFKVKLEPLERSEKKTIMKNVVKTWKKEKKGYAGTKLRQYLNWIKPVHPKLKPEIRKKTMRAIAKFIEYEKDDEEKGVRYHQSILRIAETIARLNRRNITKDDVKRAIKIRNPKFPIEVIDNVLYS